MGKGEPMNKICVEKPKVHGSDFRSMARQRRLVCVALFVALLPFAITRSYLFYTNSDVPFFQAQPAPAGEDVPHFPEVVTALPGSSSTTDNDETPQLESRSDDPALDFSETGISNLTSIAGDEEEVEEAKPKSPILDNFRSLNTSALSDSGEGENVSTSSSYLESLRGTRENITKGAEEPIGEIVMEGTTAPSTSPQNSSHLRTSEGDSGGDCNLGQGKWVPDSTPPVYNSSTCKYIQGHQNCHRNGRPDDGYLYWKWKPEHCELPRIDAAVFLTAMRNRSVVFAGDSIARNQFQSLLCILSQAEVPRHTYWSEDGRNNIYHFESSNFTLTIRWSPYLARVEDKLITWPDNITETVTHIYVDELDPNWVTAAVGADILHVSTGQWWYKRALYMEKMKALGCHGCPSCGKQLGFHKPYAKAIRNILKGSLKIPGFSGTTVYRSFSPEHFENGAWDTGGACNRTTPGGVPMSYDTTTLFGIQKEQFRNVTEEVGKDRLKLLGITDLAQSRADGHPNKYRSAEQKKSDKGANGVPNDCLHWCLPGPIDTWNDILVHSLHDVIFK